MFSFYIFIDRTEICTKSDFSPPSPGCFFDQMSLFSIKVRTFKGQLGGRRQDGQVRGSHRTAMAVS